MVKQTVVHPVCVRQTNAAPKDVHSLIPRTYDHGTLHGKRDMTDGIKVKDLRVYLGLFQAGIILNVDEEGRRMSQRCNDERRGRRESKHERNAGRRWSQTKKCEWPLSRHWEQPQLTATKKMETSILQPHGTEFCQQGTSNEMNFPLEPSERNTVC